MHESVLLAESIELLNVRPGGAYVDCTFGRGGHTREILRNLGGQGRVLAIDRDPLAIGASKEFQNDERLELVQDRFSRLGKILESRRLGEKIDGILMDLGVSSPQLDDAARGFSFRFDGPLDMRMDPSVGTSAAQWIATASESEIRDCLWEFGEERYGRRIARKIVECRSQQPISTTLELVAVIKRAVPAGYSRIHPATRTFQAIRLEVNSELEELERVLRQAADNIKVGGRVVAVSFHSLEDRMVKRYFRNLVRGPDSLLPQPNVEKFRLLTRKPVRPQDAELKQNPRARSARLRVLERVA